MEETLDKAGIPIYTVGMRILSNQTLSTLDEISQLTGGSYYYSYRISNLPDNLKKIIECCKFHRSTLRLFGYFLSISA